MAELFYNNNESAVKVFSPDFVKLAEAFGMRGLRVTDKSQVAAAIDQAMQHPGPVLVEFVVDDARTAIPWCRPAHHFRRLLISQR